MLDYSDFTFFSQNEEFSKLRKISKLRVANPSFGNGTQNSGRIAWGKEKSKVGTVD